MAERYCILPEGGTGVWTDTAIWSTTENGPGGASAPTAAADTAIFTRSATVTGRAASVRSPVTIINAAVIEIASGEACTFQGAGLRIDGTLIVDTTFDCTVNGMTTSSRSVVRKTAGRLFLAIRNTWVTDIHPGTIIESPEIVVCMNDGDTVVPAARYHGATFLGVDPRPAGEHNGRFCFADADYYFSHLRPLNINPANANYSVPKTAWRMGAARVVAGSLRFDIRNFDAVLEMSQENASITVTGDVAHSIARADALNVGPGLEIVLTGTQDQAVALPPETDGLVALRLDKPAGLVTLSRFNGLFEGKSGSLELRDFREAALCGASEFGNFSVQTPTGYGTVRFFRGGHSLDVGDMSLSCPGTRLLIHESENCDTKIRGSLLTSVGTGGLLDFLADDGFGGGAGNYPSYRAAWTLCGGETQRLVFPDGDSFQPALRIEKTMEILVDEETVPIVPETANVALEGYRGRILACHAHRLCVAADSTVRFGHTVDYDINPANAGENVSFSGKLDTLEVFGNVLFERCSAVFPDDSPFAYVDYYPELNVRRLEVDGAIRGVIEGESATEFKPGYAATIHLPWENGGPVGTGTVEETIELCRHDGPLPTIASVVLDGPDDGSGEVSLGFTTFNGVRYRIDWGDQAVDEGTVASRETTRIELDHCYAEDGRSYTVTITVWNVDDGTNYRTFSHALARMPLATIEDFTAACSEDGKGQVAISFHSRGCQSYKIDWGPWSTGTRTGESPDPVSARIAENLVLTPVGRDHLLTITVFNRRGVAHTVTETVFVLEAQTPVIDEIEVSGPDDGSGRIRLRFRLGGAYHYLVSWGDSQSSENIDLPNIGRHTYTLEHDYAEVGREYNIQITAGNYGGLRSVGEITFSLRPRATPVLTVNPSEGQSPLDVLAHLEESLADEYFIDWGDGTSSEGIMAEATLVAHCYLDPGDYVVILSVRYFGTEYRPTLQNVHVAPSESEGVLAVLNVEPTRGYAPFSVAARATGSKGTSFKFDWGDGTNTGFTTRRTASHTYERAGLYPITLTVKENKITASTSLGVIVEYRPPEPVPQPALIRVAGLPGHPKGRERVSASPYRITLAQGENYMADALELFCHMSENQRSLDTGSPLLLARIQHVGGEPVVPGEIASASYTLWRLDDRDAAVRISVPGHEGVAVPVVECLLPEPVLDENWTHDAVGYNFRHIPRSTNPDGPTPLFPVPGRNYLVEYRLVAEDPAAPDILLRYRVHVV